MFLYKFTLTYMDGKKENYFKFCTYPKKTKIYRNALNLLRNNKLIRYSYASYNNEL